MVTTLDRQGVIAQAAGWMQARGWKEKLAKRRGGGYHLKGSYPNAHQGYGEALARSS